VVAARRTLACVVVLFAGSLFSVVLSFLAVHRLLASLALAVTPSCVHDEVELEGDAVVEVEVEERREPVSGREPSGECCERSANWRERLMLDVVGALVCVVRESVGAPVGRTIDEEAKEEVGTERHEEPRGGSVKRNGEAEARGTADGRESIARLENTFSILQEED
jgi:hypothetical protein